MLPKADLRCDHHVLLYADCSVCFDPQSLKHFAAARNSRWAAWHLFDTSVRQVTCDKHGHDLVLMTAASTIVCTCPIAMSPSAQCSRGSPAEQH